MATIYDVGATINLAGQAASAAGTGTKSTPTLVYDTGTGLTVIARPATITADISVSAGGAPKLVHDLGTVIQLYAQSAQLTTPNATLVEDLGATAELLAQRATMSGTSRAAKTGAGAIVGQRATVLSLGAAERKGSGAFQAQAATVFGLSERQILTATAALVAQSGQVSSSTRKTATAVGALVVSPAVVVATGKVERKSTAALIAGAGVFAGIGGHSTALGPVGSGNLLADAATTTTATGVTKFAVGALLAGEATLESGGKKEITGRAQLKALPAYVALDAASGDLLTWEMDDAIWGQPSVIHARDWPVFAKGNRFFQADFGRYFDKEPVRVVLERTGLSILGRDRQGNWKVNAGVIKFISGVWPYLKGTPGTEVLVYVGSQMFTEEAITWEGPYKAIIGQTEFLDFTVSGRYMAVRFESVGQPPWELVSYDLDLTTVGER